jgi:hypothetical protein
VEAEIITKTYDCVELPPLDLAEEKSICFSCVSRPSQSSRISSNLCLQAFFPSCEFKLDETSYGVQWTDLKTSDLQKSSLALPDQSLQWLLEIEVTIHYQISLAQHQVAMRLCGPPSLLICSIFEIAYAGDVFLQPPIYLQSLLRANEDMTYENLQWLSFAGDSNSSTFHPGETKYFIKAPGKYLRLQRFLHPGLFGFISLALIHWERLWFSIGHACTKKQCDDQDLNFDIIFTLETQHRQYQIYNCGH